MATGSVKGYRTGTVTGYNSSSPSMDVRQVGNVVTINGYCNNVAMPSGKWATLSGVDLPPVAVRTLCGVASGAYEHPQDVAYVVIATNGDLDIGSNVSSGRRAIWFSVSYIV